MTGLLIATSIAPGGRVDVQRRAVESWRQAGLTFVSLNSPAEIERLAGDFPDVDFIPQLRDARLAVGKPVIYINDILQHFRESGADRFGISNSDIFVNGTVMDFVNDQPEDAFIACPRTEVDDFGASSGSLDLQDNTIGFGDGFRADRFEVLRGAAAAAESFGASEEIRLNRMEELAAYYDELSRYTVKFIDEKFEKVSLPA